MSTNNTIKIKRRITGNSGSPETLLNGEIAFNEVDGILYYGKGTNQNGVSTSIITIAGTHTDILKDSQISTVSTPLTASNEYLIINVNGQQKAIRLFDF